MDRSYFEYSQIVESFINRQSSASSPSSEADYNNSQSTKIDERDRRMKLAFLNVLREEMG